MREFGDPDHPAVVDDDGSISGKKADASLFQYGDRLVRCMSCRCLVGPKDILVDINDMPICKDKNRCKRLGYSAIPVKLW